MSALHDNIEPFFNDPIRGNVFDTDFGAMLIPWHANFQQYPITVEVWIKPHRPGMAVISCNAPAENSQDGSNHYWSMMIGTGGDLTCTVAGRKQIRFIWTEKSILDGCWHHLAIYFDGETAELYTDGIRVAEKSVANSIAPHPYPAGLVIGSHKPFYARGGLIDQIRISRGRHVTERENQFKLDDATIGLWHFGNANISQLIYDAAKKFAPARLIQIPTSSMDDDDRKSFNAGPTPFDGPAERIMLTPGKCDLHSGPTQFSLDGTWEMADGGDPATRLTGAPWCDAIPADVPGSVHAALEKAGRLPDPKFAKNDAEAREKSFHTWWFRKRFARPNGNNPRLVCDGVAIRCTTWLNGNQLGTHEGMFGGPEYDITHALQDQNELVIRIDPAPYNRTNSNSQDNNGWRQTVVFNNVYGWHYSNIPSLGIWRSVRIESAPAIKMAQPFVVTRDAHKGEMSLAIDLAGPKESWSGTLRGVIRGENFASEPQQFEKTIRSMGGSQRLCLQFTISNPRLWWPLDIGDPNLYHLTLEFIPSTGQADHYETTFGIRTIQMAPLPQGEKPDLYNWTFVINGRPTFMKGTGWCTMDSSMDFRRSRYERLLRAAQAEHCQMVRAWGSGMPETDDFYDLCDRLGITVMQEWPTAWNSHNEQPYDILEETVRLNTIRLRNHPSLIMWGGGNESTRPFGKAIDMMGRHAIELDGTRPFHRGEPWGGSIHAYPTWWERKTMDEHLHIKGAFLGEFGIPSLPVMESVLRYLPDNEKKQWPPQKGSAFLHHTPIFNTVEEWERMQFCAGLFTAGETMERMVLGTQLAQVVGMRHALELARTRWPDCTGALLYKLNDNYPAVSWATVDWYGAYKIGHYFVQDAFAPLHACVIFDHLNHANGPLKLPVYLLNDTRQKSDSAWQVQVRAYDGKLQVISCKHFAIEGAEAVSRIGEFVLTEEQATAVPLLIVAEVLSKGKIIDRTFYFINMERKKECLFELPRTSLKLDVESNRVRVINIGKIPAVAVAVLRLGQLDTFNASDNYFWLDPGESREVIVSHTDGLTVEALNADRN